MRELIQMRNLLLFRSPGRVIAWIALLIFLLVSLFPILWMLLLALRPGAELFSNPGGLLPKNLTIINFERVLGLLSLEESQQAGGSGASVNFVAYLTNTAIMMFGMVFGQVVFSTLAAYAFARLRFPGQNAVFAAFLCALMVPGIVTIIPNYITIWQLGWLNTFHGLIAPFFLFSPISIFFMRQYFLSMSREIEEAARVDGASVFTSFWRITLPMATPGVSTLVIFNALAAWNEYLWPLLAGRNEATRTINVALAIFRQQTPGGIPDFTGLMAASAISMLPIFLLLVLLGRKMLDSLGGFSGLK